MSDTHIQRGAASVALAMLAALSLLAPSRLAAQWSPSRVDAHAPIGVMGDHRHERGEVMLSFRAMPMEMKGSRKGTSDIANADILSPSGENFMITPVSMSMQMYMAGAMYAPSDRITLMAMVPFVNSSMDHVTRAGGAFTTASQGLGDVGLSAMVGVAEWGNQLAHLNLGVTLPTGSITATDVLPTSSGSEVQLPYPMQLGSGTLDLRPGATWLGQTERVSWGAQAMGTIRLGENDRDWSLGNRLDATTWLGVPLAHDVSVSLRGAFASWGNVDGVDAAPSVNPMMVPTARRDLRGGTRLDGGIGVNWYAYRPAGLRFSGELLAPVYQSLNGPQLKQRYTLVFGAQVIPVH